MPRLFTGVELPRMTADQLSLLRGGLPEASGRVRWIDPENYHITLRFIGDIDHGVAREVVSALDRVAGGPMTLTIDGLSSFGGNKPHSVFARIAPTEELMDLQATHERVLQRLGLKPEGRKFVPHVTLARLRGIQPEAVAHWLSQRGGLMRLDFEVERFVLFSSRDSVGGGPYVVEEDYPLVA